MQKVGVNMIAMIALTIQNEPEGRPAITPWETLTYGVEEF